MSGEDAIEVEGIVVEVVSNGRYRVALPNQHRIFAYISAKMRLRSAAFALGDRVTVAMSPFDLSKGRITLKEENGKLL